MEMSWNLRVHDVNDQSRTTVTQTKLVESVQEEAVSPGSACTHYSIFKEGAFHIKNCGKLTPKFCAVLQNPW